MRPLAPPFSNTLNANIAVVNIAGCNPFLHFLPALSYPILPHCTDLHSK